MTETAFAESAVVAGVAFAALPEGARLEAGSKAVGTRRADLGTRHDLAVVCHPVGLVPLRCHRDLSERNLQVNFDHLCVCGSPYQTCSEVATVGGPCRAFARSSVVCPDGQSGAHVVPRASSRRKPTCPKTNCGVDSSCCAFSCGGGSLNENASCTSVRGDGATSASANDAHVGRYVVTVATHGCANASGGCNKAESACTYTSFCLRISYLWRFCFVSGTTCVM